QPQRKSGKQRKPNRETREHVQNGEADANTHKPHDQKNRVLPEHFALLVLIFHATDDAECSCSGRAGRARPACKRGGSPALAWSTFVSEGCHLFVFVFVIVAARSGYCGDYFSI